MKKLFLHIGLGKTGSSALQSWLSLNSKALSKQGVDYADLVPHAKTGEVSSGNGYVLQRALVSQDFEEVERLLTSTYFFNPRNNIALISCELFQGVRKPFLEKFHDICAKCNIDVTVVVYIRSVYEQLYSTYLQGIKRASIAHRFGEKGSDISFHRSVEYLRQYVRVFGDRVIAINYDIAKKDIYASIAGIVGFESKGLKKLKKKVNRSLTLEEAEVFRSMNYLHGGVFATQISDFVIKLAPDVETPVFYDQSLVKKVRDATEEDLLWVNVQFKMPIPVASDFYDGHSSSGSITLTRESYKPVIRWAMGFDPGPTLRREFATFLRRFGAFMMDICFEDVISLENMHRRVRFEIEQESAQGGLGETEGGIFKNPMVAYASKAQGTQQPKSLKLPLPAHIIAYFHDARTMSEQEKSQINLKFNDWLSSLEKHAFGDTFNAVASTTVLHGDDPVTTRKESAMTGYTLIEIEDMDAVLSLVENCPLLEVGGALKVSRTVNLFGRE